MIDRSRLARAFGVLTLLAALAACGGGGSSSPAAQNPSGNNGGNAPGGGGPTTETIEGVATPSSVAVVTATNTN